MTPPRKTDDLGREIYPTEDALFARLKTLRAVGVNTGYMQVPGGFVLKHNPEVIR